MTPDAAAGLGGAVRWCPRPLSRGGPQVLSLPHGLGCAPDAPLLVHGTSGMIVAFRAALTAVLML